MSTKDFSEMMDRVWRIKWFKYRYVLIAALVVNLLLINQFFFEESLINLNPYRSSPAISDPTVENEVKEEIATPATPATPATSSEKLAVPPPVSSAVLSSAALPSASSVPASATSVEASAAATASSPSPAKSSVLTAVSPAIIPSTSHETIFNLHDYHFDGQYVGWPLQRVCDETEWIPGLIFVCDNNSGGIGNIRNFILTCIRYAIDAGASEIMIPRIQLRSEEDLANIFTAGFQPFDYFFDQEHFLNSIATYCPQMHVRLRLEDVPNGNKTMKVENFYPKDLNVDFDGCDERGVNRHLDMFRTKIHQWLVNTRHMPTAEEPVSIRFKWATFFEWPIYRDGPEFATTFGDLLRIRKDIKELAASALSEMSSFVGIEPNTSRFDAPYLGVHLRTEADALGFWPTFEQQSDGYIEQAVTRGIKHVYLACGDASQAKKFADKAYNETQLQVTTKLQLLKGENLNRLNNLTWDQQALVDFLMLEKGAHFTGCSFSSFSMNIAMKRHLMTGGINSRPWKSPADQYSTLIGRFESWYDDWMFMYECMWP